MVRRAPGSIGGAKVTGGAGVAARLAESVKITLYFNSASEGNILRRPPNERAERVAATLGPDFARSGGFTRHWYKPGRTDRQRVIPRSSPIARQNGERMSARKYAADRGVEIIEGNPRSYRMARKMQAEVIDDLKDRHSDLGDQVEELQEENKSLQGRLDAAADAIAGEEEAEDESDLEEADDDADADESDD
jgi:hypothetical protein